MQARLHALDGLRATAMFLGIVLHACASFAVTLPLPWIVRDARGGPSFDLVMGVIHGFRMPLFFFIAGFFAHLVWRKCGTRDFIVHRWRRIGVPFALGMGTILPLSILIFLWADTGEPRPKGSLPTMHLWFLEMLLVLYALVAAIAWASRLWARAELGFRLDGAFEALFRSRGRPFVLAALTVIPLWNGPTWGEVDHMGVSVALAPRAIAYFGLFFAVGWWLHRCLHLLDTLRDRPGAQFAIAFLALSAWFACLAMGLQPTDPHYLAYKAGALAAAALYAWTMTFALTGLFLRIAATDRPWARYLADASYWCYLAHLPLVFVLQVLVAGLPFAGWLKAGLVILVASGVLLASYELLVRYTWIGGMLNGPRPRARG